jgi:tight adherence protein C
MELAAVVPAALVILSLFLGKWALSNGGSSNSDVRSNLARPSIEAGRMVATDNAGRRSLGRLLASVTHGSGGQLMPKLGIRMAQAGLGGRWTVERMLGLKLLLAFAVLLPGVLWFVSSLNPLILLAAIVLAVFLYFYPDVRLTSVSQARMAEVERQLPDILDRLTVSLDAGLGFETALAKVVDGRTGAGYVEFRRVQQDLQLGFPRDLALAAMSQRLPIADLRLVLDAILQSGKYGLSLTSVLRTQADELRDRRKMRAQERAMKVPVKILIPLILCILPALFVVLVGPAVMQIKDAFS